MKIQNEDRGLFIAIEGMDGSGKSTGAGYITQCLRNLGLNLITTREIGGTKLGETIRAACLTLDEPVDPLARLLAFMASRTQHIANVISPNIAAGVSVVCDRYSDSTFVYQGVVDSLLPQYLELINTRALSHLSRRPDVTVFFRVDPEIAFARGNLRTNLDNDLYKKNKDLAHVIAQAYDRVYAGLSAEYRGNILIVDGNQPIETVNECLQKFAKRIYDGYMDPF